MDSVKYILSDKHIESEVAYPYLNTYNFLIFNKTTVININNILWIRYDDVERILSKYIKNFNTFISKNNLKYLYELTYVPFWDIYSDMYIHESDFLLLAVIAGIDWYPLSIILNNIRDKKKNIMLENNNLKKVIKESILQRYNYSITFNNEYNYIITKYYKMFTVFCIESNERIYFML
jgi:hypothetical protein